jgi:hypothetical protein
MPAGATVRLLPELIGPAIDGITFEDLGDRLVLRADRDLDGLAAERFSRPRLAVSFGPSQIAAPDVSLVGFAYTQFALPVRADLDGGFDFAPAANLRSPSAVMPLVMSSGDGRVELLAPLDSWHEQIISVRQNDPGPRIDDLAWGWHGDLDQVPAGFATTLGVFTGRSVGEVFERWGAAIRVADISRRSDPLLTHLSYWTDNGAAYWYRTEPGRDITTTLADKVDELDRLGVPVNSVELDSWFYPHEISRSVDEQGYLEEVPPTGMLEWAPRPDVFPDGLGPLRRALADRPLVLHSRHISPQSAYLDEGEWWVDRSAQPRDPAFFDRWCRDAASWGATCIELDWMMISFFGNRPLREVPGRVMAWQQQLDRGAAANDLGLLWCMALPGDMAAAVELGSVIALRTCDDYRFAADPALLWIWYLTVNRMADALGVPVFKDCFFSAQPRGDDSIDGDEHAELEALLAAMSGGVVGLGDRIGCTDADVVLRVCRPDGRLVGPDRPISLCEQSFFDPGTSADRLCWASTTSTNARGTWHYVLAVHVGEPGERPVADFACLRSITGSEDEMLVYEWRAGTAAPATELEASLTTRDWSLFVCCPIVVDDEGRRSALIGDPSRYATMSSARVDAGPAPHVILAPDEPPVPLLSWSDADGLTTS